MLNQADLPRIGGVARLTRQAQLASDKLPNLCIAHTQMLISVLRVLGYSAEPITVRLVIDNAQMARLRDDQQWVSADDARQSQIIANTGGFAINVGWEVVSKNGWAGHLIAHVASLSCFVDVSADQANDVAHGISIPGPIVFIGRQPTSVRVPGGESRTGHLHPLAGGARIAYMLYPEDRSYECTVGWQMTPERIAVYTELGELIRVQLGRAGF